jgi:hypothetical protein
VTTGTNVLSPAQSPCAAYINDPLLIASCVPSTKTDRWFVFTPAATADYRIETCGSTYDTVLSVYTACNGSELACNDNYTTGPSSGCASNRSRIGSITLDGGVSYYIRIAAPATAFLSSTATMNLSIGSAPMPVANDQCSSPAPAVLGTNAFDTTEASPDGVIVSCSTTSDLSRDVWFSYVPTYKGRLRAATCPGTTWNTVLSIHDGPCGTELACNDNAGVTGCTNQSIISNFNVNAGATYVLRVAGSNASALGAGQLTLSFTCAADYNNDNVVNSQDYFDFLVAFFNNDIAADFNGDLVVNSQDYFDFLTEFFSGCV